jgi:branched-chain amino acid transport system permease protein
MGNLLGVVLGATLVVALPEIFREFQAYRLLVFGLLLMVLMVFRPQGLLAPPGRRRQEADASATAEVAVAAEAPSERP